MKPNYVAKKTAWTAVSIWKILFFWLIIPLIVMICQIICIKHERIEFYDDYIVVKKGVFSKSTKTYVIPGIITVSTERSFGARLGGYGNVKMQVLGKSLDVDLNNVKKPKKLKAYLDTKLIDPKRIRVVMGTDKLKF